MRHCFRFRIPYSFFADLVVDLRGRPEDQHWVHKHDKADASGRKAAPLELLVLSVLRILGRAFTFDDCEESTNISQETIRVFFHAFCEFFGTIKYDEEVKAPSTAAEAEECEEVMIVMHVDSIISFSFSMYRFNVNFHSCLSFHKLVYIQIYRAAGFDGCIGSIDCTHLWWDRTPATLTNLCKGAKGYTSLAFELIVNHKRQILYSSNSFNGSENDKVRLN